jgi:hypothetical protein
MIGSASQKLVIIETKSYHDRVVMVCGYTALNGRGPIGLYYTVNIEGHQYSGCLGSFTSEADAIREAQAVIAKSAPQS